jgi:hypothetical protein
MSSRSIDALRDDVLRVARLFADRRDRMRWTLLTVTTREPSAASGRSSSRPVRAKWPRWGVGGLRAARRVAGISRSGCDDGDPTFTPARVLGGGHDTAEGTLDVALQ